MISEKLYMLRKKQGLSQEQLAERLNVSRQAISKWESGQSVPDTDKLLSIGEYFQVSLDYLLREEGEFPSAQQKSEEQISGEKLNFAGLIICVGGILLLIVWGLISILNPSSSRQISDSSMVQIDGNGIFLFSCVMAIIVGAWLLLRDSQK